MQAVRFLAALRLESWIMSLVRKHSTPFAAGAGAGLTGAVCCVQSWHPMERMLAVAADNTMYIHSESDTKSV